MKLNLVLDDERLVAVRSPRRLPGFSIRNPGGIVDDANGGTAFSYFVPLDRVEEALEKGAVLSYPMGLAHFNKPWQ